MNAPRTRVQRRPVHGVLLLDKPLGISSNQALQKAKYLLRAEKAGHTGTLDPLASGLLPLCFGAATKFGQLQLDADKTYETTVRLGVRTTTADAEGEVIEVRPVSCTMAQVLAVIAQYTGQISQLPPMYSALKKDGKPLYEYARAGEVLERSTRKVSIHALDLLEAQLSGDLPFLRLRVRCSKGTYIRTLGEDIASALGCGGHLLALRRVGSGPFDISQATPLSTLEDMSDANRQQLLQPSESLLDGHLSICLDDEQAGRFLCGMRRRGNWADAEQVAVYATSTQSGRQSLLGTGHVKAGELIPGRLLSPVEIQQILEVKS